MKYVGRVIELEPFPFLAPKKERRDERERVALGSFEIVARSSSMEIVKAGS